MSETSRRLCFACRNAVDSDEQFVLARGRPAAGALLGGVRARDLREVAPRPDAVAPPRGRQRDRAALAAGGRLDGVAAPRAAAALDRAFVGRRHLGQGAARRNRRTTARPGRPPTPTGRSRSIGRGGRIRCRARRAARRPPTIACSRPIRTRIGQCAGRRARAASRWAASCGASTSTRRWTVSSIARRPAAPTSTAAVTCASPTSAAWSSRTTFTWPRSRAAWCGAHASRPARSSAWSATPGRAAKNRRPHPHLHFALSIRPSAEWPETFWDPTPLMATWPLRVPPHGSVAGLVAATDTMEIPRRHRGH